MAYDPLLDRTVVCGGVTGSGSDMPAMDCWAWDGTRWELLSTIDSSSGTLVFDPVRGKLVYIYYNTSVGDAFDTCVYDSGWDCTTTPIVGQSPSLSSSVAIFDAALGSLIITASIYNGPDDPRSLGTWIEGEGEWTQIIPSPTPAALSPPSPSLSGYYDPVRGRSVYHDKFGIYEFDGVRWFHAHDSTPSAYRDQAAMALDSTGRGILFGGTDAASSTDDDSTFAWDGSTWLELFPESSPSPRSLHGLVYAAKSGMTVLFGGFSVGATLGDTWLWDGATESWSLATGDGPPARADHAMGYDPISGEVIVFGGTDGYSQLNDTWRWDGQSWMPVSTDRSPRARNRAIMVWDPNRRRLVLYGGIDTFGETLKDTWEWDPEAEHWGEIGITAFTEGHRDHAGTYHAVTSRVVSLGGSSDDPIDARPYFHTFGLHTAEDRCDLAIDIDGDGLSGCDEPSCWARCNPLCTPTTADAECEMTPRCGDGECNKALENSLNCPGECPAGDVCGDFACTGDENATDCPGDCG